MTNNSGRVVFQERRRAIRVQDAIALHIAGSGEEPTFSPATLPTHKISLSAGGLAFASEQLWHPGDRLQLMIMLFPACHCVRTAARVVSANDAPEIADGDKPTYRVAFEFLSSADREFIEAHVAGLSNQRPEPD